MLKTEEEKKARHREYQRVWYAKRRAEFFKDKKCTNCGSTENLELDHKNPANKWKHRIWSYCWKRIKAETKKCQILCRKCHYKKTAEDIRKMRKKAHGTLDGYVKWHCRCEQCMKIGRTLKSEEYTSGINLDISEDIG